MSERCFCCQEEFDVESMVAYHSPYDSGNVARMCSSCNENDSNIIVYNGYDPAERYPVGFLPVYTAYDGEDSSRCVRPKLFSDRDDIETCGYCDNMFYGRTIYITDADSRWCEHCTDNHASYCEYDEEYYEDPDNMPSEEDEERSSCRTNIETDTEVNGFRIFKGQPTSRFLAHPLVGIEFEHAPVRTSKNGSNNDALYLAIVAGRDPNGIPWSSKFTIHGDGSIKWQEGYSSSEIVSMPASGDQLEMSIRRFYEPFGNGAFMPGPEHHSCGFHMHVASEYLFMMKRGKIDDNPKAQEFPRTLLTHIHKICKEFVSSSRRNNTYCSNYPAIREKNMSEAGANQMARVFGRGGYPAISVRSFGTIEYRIWPSSNSVRNTLARAELSQKLTAWWDSVLIKDGEFAYNFEEAKKIEEISEKCACGRRAVVPDMLADLLGLSSACREDLKRMSQRFSPFTHKATTFKFSDSQLAALDSEPTEVSLNMHRFADVSLAGDTTAVVAEKETDERVEYLAFGVQCKCYSDEENPQMSAMVAQLAKGEA